MKLLFKKGKGLIPQLSALKPPNGDLSWSAKINIQTFKFLENSPQK
jgi:hypothetical protein